MTDLKGDAFELAYILSMCHCHNLIGLVLWPTRRKVPGLDRVKQFIPVVLIIMPCLLALTLDLFQCDRSNKSYLIALAFEFNYE